MATYRVYFIESDKHIRRVPETVECADDQIAIGKAQHLVDGQDVEVWEGSRLVARFPTPSDGRFSTLNPVGIARPKVWVQIIPVEFKGIRYTLLARVERNRWTVAIHPEGTEAVVKPVNGPREKAELMARSMIDKWLKEHPS